ADRYNRGKLLKITISSSFLLTTLLCVLIFQDWDIPIVVFLLYSLGRGMMSAIETQVRQSVLPDLSKRLTTTQVVSYHSVIINICPLIGPAIVGLVMANYNAQIRFSIQAICYLISRIICLTLKFEQPHYNEVEKQMSIKFVFEYFNDNSVGTRIFVP